MTGREGLAVVLLLRAAGHAKQCLHTRLPYPGISRPSDLADDVTTLIERLSTDQGDNEESDDG